MPVLTAIDVLGVQRFVFASNRLRDVVAGSFLVDCSTSSDRALSNRVPKGSVLLAGGGNSIIEFDSLDEAREFTARYTRNLYDQAPGLEVAVAHKPFEPGGLARALQEIQIELARVKTERRPAAPLLGLSVNETCGETGMPAVGFDSSDPSVPLSNGVLKRREKKDEARRHWSEYLREWDGFAFPMELDQLGRTVGDTSLMGVVHVDGNGVGEKIKVWLARKADNGAGDEMVREEYRQWSQAIDELGKRSFQAVVDRVCGAVVGEHDAVKKMAGKPATLGFELKAVNGEWMLPLRPIVLGGDDLTFVCDGRIALDLTETALAVFEASDVPHLGKITASAGVALTRAHAPFARAYQLAEKLCASAKRMRKEKKLQGCALDWHSGISRPGETVTDIRERQYRGNTYHLTCRPYPLGSGKDDPETWRWLSKTLLDDPRVGLRGETWSGRRSKVKAFAELAREGPDSVKAAVEAWKVAAKNLCLAKAVAEDGFFATSRTPLLDALELLDLHLVLEPDSHYRRQKEDKP
jgi:hypothetical protein